nr:reverse transcriptase domain-containing protein [Tanacetum cinerariifolium]
DLSASINLMPYSLYVKLSLETLKPTKMSIRLADISFQYPVGIAKNMLVEVVIRVKQKQINLGVGTKRMIFNIDATGNEYSRNGQKPADLGASINLMPYSLYVKLSLETLKPTKMSVRLADISFQYPVGIAKNMLVEVVIRVKQKQINLGIGTKRMIFNIDATIKHSYSNDDTYFSIDVIDEILEEDFDVLLDEGSKILHSIEGTVLEEEIFSEFDKFIEMNANENYDSESDTEEPPFEKITINTDYKSKTSLEEPPTDLELKLLPDNLEYVFLEEPSFFHVIISS